MQHLQGLEASILLPVLNVSLQKCLIHCLIWEKFPERPFLLMVQKLKPVANKVSEKTIYKCEDCNGCPYKSECIKGNHCKTPLEERTKTLQVAKTFLKHRKEDLDRILFRTNRSIQAEGSFGDLKQDMQFRRYLSKGNANILAESTLLAMAKAQTQMIRQGR